LERIAEEENGILGRAGGIIQKMIKIIIVAIFLFFILPIRGLCDDNIKFVDLNADNFQEEVLECKTLVIIDLYAVWCKPCDQLLPVLERLSEFYKDKIKIVRVDVDHNRKFLDNFRPLWGLPVLVFYKNGKEVGRILGFVPFTTISNKIISLLKEGREDKKEKKKDGCDGGVCPPPEGYKKGVM